MYFIFQQYYFILVRKNDDIGTLFIIWFPQDSLPSLKFLATSQHLHNILKTNKSISVVICEHLTYFGALKS